MGGVDFRADEFGANEFGVSSDLHRCVSLGTRRHAADPRALDFDCAHCACIFHGGDGGDPEQNLRRAVGVGQCPSCKQREVNALEQPGIAKNRAFRGGIDDLPRRDRERVIKGDFAGGISRGLRSANHQRNVHRVAGDGQAIGGFNHRN